MDIDTVILEIKHMILEELQEYFRLKKLLEKMNKI